MVKKDNVYLFSEKNREYKIIRELSQSEVEKIEYANEVLHEFLYFERRFEVINRNYKEYHETVYRYSKNRKDGIKINKEYMNETFVEINRTFINFISSLKSYSEHLDIKLANKYPNKEEYLNFKKAVSLIYDNNFSYKFLSILRDYAIHYNFPIQIVRIKGNRIEDSEDFTKELIIEFEKEKLLKNPRMKKKLGKDLEKYNNFFPVQFIVHDIKKIFIQLFNEFLKVEKTFYQEQANLFQKFLSENINTDTTCYGKITKKGDTDFIYETIVIQENIVKRLNELLNESPFKN
ncbi:hypothetical protein [uncultured Arcticibacterium sp.]|uniref:hypothetical protein n=1 Tax=uncultured Arcticibacterium sp. TaxID=2173042 RepID=UPI0030F81AED